MVWVGWDWASESHDVTVISGDGHEVLGRRGFGHCEDELGAALDWLGGFGLPEDIAVAIETPSGLVVDRLIERGYPVVPVHPRAFKAARPRWGMSGAKSDPGDSYKLADYLRTDGHRLRRLRPAEQATCELRALCRLRDDHVAAKLAAENQLAAVLDLYWPGPKALFSRLGSRISLAFLAAYPTPGSARGLNADGLEAFCSAHGYSGRRRPRELADRLQRAPRPAAAIGDDTLAALIGPQTALITVLLDSIAALDATITAKLARHAKTPLLAPMPRIGTINLAQIISEIGPILDRSATVEQAAAEIGASPVTKESGKGRHVEFRWAANTTARKALSTFADNSRHDCAWAAELYNAARQRGKRHPHAIRILMRAWIRVIWACWHNNTTYNPDLRRPPTQQCAA